MKLVADGQQYSVSEGTDPLSHADWPRYSLDCELGRLVQIFHSRARRCAVTVSRNTYSCTWEMAEKFADSHVILQNAESTILVSIEEYPSSLEPDEREWWEYNEASRLLAWSIQHEVLIDLLQAQLGSKLRPTETLLADVNAKARCSLRWRFQVAGVSMVGSVLLDSIMLRHLLNHNTWVSTPPRPLRYQLTGQLRIEIPIGALSRVEVQDTAAGDVFLFEGTSHACKSVLVIIPAADRYWGATLTEHRVTLCTPATQHQYRKHSMTHENYSSPASNEPTATNRSNLVTLEQVKIHLALQLGETEVTLGDLEHMQPGYVIEFPQTMTPFRPVLLANGQPIGRGELVSLGNRMGVRVTEWSNNGL